ncbi:MAG: PhoH family protein [Burkholderiaceae bacterium]
MPLPKAPTKPADVVDMKSATLARAARSGSRGNKRGQPGARPTAEAATASAASADDVTRPAKARLLDPHAALPAHDSGEPAGRSVPAQTRQAPLRPLEIPAAPVSAKAPAASARALPPTKASPRGGARRRRARNDRRRLFVLDTNVLMHDPSCLFRFAEHDVFLPIVTLEELDGHKRGMSEVARNARQFSRSIDDLLAATGEPIERGLPLAPDAAAGSSGRLFFQNRDLVIEASPLLPIGKADNQIIGVVAALQARDPDRDVVLVSKDINMRIKASMLGLTAEDYFSDQVVEDTDLLDPGVQPLPDDFWETHQKGMESWQDAGSTFYRLRGPMAARLRLNQFVTFDGELPLQAQVIERTERHIVLRSVRDYGHVKNSVWGITARNREQNFALNLLCDPEIDFVTLLGQAGTGKTLLALAAGLSQVLDQKRYAEIIMTRATVPVGDDIGYLPGTEEEKMQPWMGALEDNLEVLNQPDSAAGDWGRSASADLIKNRIRVKSLSFMRGRTFVNKFLIIDEAQNLTPKQMKTLITRAGPGTKVICLGNIAQIDTPYLTEGSSGLTYVVDRMRGWMHAGHVTLQRGERSRLADYAADHL